MTPDHFALFGIPRRPWLDPESLKESFHRLAARAHPDRTGEAGESAELNAAYAALREPASRLRHLLELEHPERPGEAAPVTPAMAEIFLRLATLRRAVDAFVEQQSQAGTPLGQALLHSERFTLLRDLEKERAALETLAARVLGEVQALDAVWEARAPETVARLAELQQELAYFGKWQWQLREAQFRLETGGAHV